MNRHSSPSASFKARAGCPPFRRDSHKLFVTRSEFLALLSEEERALFSLGKRISTATREALMVEEGTAYVEFHGLRFSDEKARNVAYPSAKLKQSFSPSPIDYISLSLNC